MKEPQLEGSFWPSERQKLLLRTAFGTGEASADAWRVLRPRLDLDRLEFGSFPVLPLVHRRLERFGIDDPYLARLAGIRRRTWFLNRLELAALAPALLSLEKAGADALVVGGWQFPAHYYDGDFGLRPVQGLEVLVRPASFDVCVRALVAGGFAPTTAAVGGEIRLVHSEGRICILRERLAREFSASDRGIEFASLRDQSVEIALAGTSARVLEPSDELVRVCLDGARATSPPNIVWLADALAVLQAAGPALDWQRIVRHALLLRAVLRLRDALVYLRRELGAPVPETVLEELGACPVRRREALAHRKAGRSTRVVTTRFLHVTANRPLPAALVSLPGFLRDEFGLRRRTQVPLEIVGRAARRVRKRSDAAAPWPPVGA